MLWHNGSLPTQIIVVGSKLQCIINFMDPLHNKIHKNLCSMNNDETTLVDKIGSKKAGSLTFKHFYKVLFVLSMLMNALTQWHKNRLELQKTSQSSTGIDTPHNHYRFSFVFFIFFSLLFPSIVSYQFLYAFYEE